MSDKLVRIKNRYDTASNWYEENPILAAGEIGIDSTNNIIKVGNGKDGWNSLRYINHMKLYRYIDPKNAPYTKISIKNIPISYKDMSGEALLTISVPGYFSYGYVLDYPYINSLMRSEKNSSFKMNFISLTDANADYYSDRVELQVDIDVHPDTYTIDLSVDALNNYNNVKNNVLNLHIDDNDGACYITTPIYMSFEDLN